jgi:hypothetical protein
MCDQQMNHLLITERMVLLRQACCGPGVKKQEMAIEIMEENRPDRKLEIKCQVSHKIQFFPPDDGPGEV